MFCILWKYENPMPKFYKQESVENLDILKYMLKSEWKLIIRWQYHVFIFKEKSYLNLSIFSHL